MYRSDLVSRLAELNPQLKIIDAELSAQVIFDALSATLSKFGSFCLNHKRARQARNPRTGEIVEVPAKYVPRFKAGKELKERVSCD